MKHHPTPLVLLILVPLVAVALGTGLLAAALVYWPTRGDGARRDLAYGQALASTRPAGLAPGYADVDHDGVADVPADPRDQKHPARLACCLDSTVDGDALAHALSASKITFDEVRLATTDAKLQGLRDGTLDLAAIPAEDVPRAVSTAGFRPLARPDDRRAQALLLASRKSSLTSLSEVGRGARPALLLTSVLQRWPAALLRGQGLVAGRDFDVFYSGSAQASRVVLAGEGRSYGRPVIVALDTAQLGDLRPADFRTLLASTEARPLPAVGVRHDLAPELQEELLKALLRSGARVEARYLEDYAFWRSLDADSAPTLPTPPTRP